MDADQGPDGDLLAAVQACLRAAFAAGTKFDQPYDHWMVGPVFPDAVAEALSGLPFAAAGVEGVSGKRELHNDTRRYFDAANNARLAACAAVSDAFQSDAVALAIQAATGADLAGSYVRLEYAQDTDGFWLEPHTDLGVKRFTMLIYLARAGQEDLGTDIYRDHETWAKRTAFVSNSALVFVPGADTWHGLERRPIAGVRKSLIMNYVTDGWRARDQLAFPTTPVLS
ncbi:MAG TPA: hypothetical protein VFC47_05500 [Caulobacteraceae bacterium]|nr:hypothetical protein [Caulobacteraceae bacterium]